MHAYLSILAMKAGKHVYCEKPLTHNIRGARIVARVAKETGVATQMGNHGRLGEGHRLTVEWLQDGAIGAMRKVHGWAGGARDLQNPGAAKDWPSSRRDLWLGPRPEPPYSGRLTPFVWRYVWDFGNGTSHVRWPGEARLKGGPARVTVPDRSATAPSTRAPRST